MNANRFLPPQVSIRTANIYTESMHRFPRKRFPLFLLTASLSLALIAGCRSPSVQTTVRNTGTTELQNIEVDYPSASFGISSLAPGEAFRYSLKLRDAGRMKVKFFDSMKKSHSGQGPYAAEGQHGTLTLDLDGNGKNVWTANLRPYVATPKGE